MSALANGYSVTIKQKVGNSTTNIYPYTRSKNVITAAGNNLETLLDEIENSDGTIKTATTSQAGIVQLSNSTTSDSETLAATAAAVKSVKDAVDSLSTTAGSTYVKLTQLGVASTTGEGAVTGVATLDTSGKVPQSQLPSYVDDVIEGYYKSADGKFYQSKSGDEYSTEITGESGKIYVDLDTNKTYRWGGSAFAVISETLAIGETASTAFAGDRGVALETAVANLQGDAKTFSGYSENATASALANGVLKITTGTGASATDQFINVYDDSDVQTALGNLSNFSSRTDYDVVHGGLTADGTGEPAQIKADILSAIGLNDSGNIKIATSSNDGFMSSTQAGKLDNCMEIAVAASAPSFTNGIWIKIEEDETAVTP